MGSPIVWDEGFSVTCNKCGCDSVDFEYEDCGIKMECRNCGADSYSNMYTNEEDIDFVNSINSANNNITPEYPKKDDEVMIVFENLEDIIAKKEFIDYEIRNGFIVEITIKKNAVVRHNDWYYDECGIYERICMYRDITYIVDDKGNDIPVAEDNIKSDFDNRLQSQYIDKNGNIVILFKYFKHIE